MKFSRILLVMGFIFLFLNLIIAVIPVTVTVNVWETRSGSLIIIGIVAGLALIFLVSTPLVKYIFRK